MIRFENFETKRPADTRELKDIKRFNDIGAAVDQFDAQDFNVNDCGFIRNDISQLMRAQSQAEYDMKLKSLVERSSNTLPSDMSISDAMKTIIPRSCQSPAELAQFAEVLASRDMDKLDDAYREALKNQQLVEQPVEKPVEQPANVETKS